MRRLAFISLMSFASAALAAEPDVAPPPATTMPVEPWLVKQAEGPGPTLDANVVRLLNAVPEREANALVLPATRDAVPESFELRFAVRLEPGGEGLGIVMRDAATSDADPRRTIERIEEWDEPNVPDAIDIGLDGRNPPAGSGDASDGDGNVYDRPQREASVHANGREVFNRQSPDFATGRPVPVVVGVRFVPGGALLTLSVAGRSVYADELLAGVAAFSPRIAIGARSGATRVRLDVREVVLTRGPDLAEPFAPPRRVALFDKALVSLGTSREPTVTPAFGEAARGAARVIATFRIAAPPGGMDRLDRRGALYCHAADGQRYELFRFRTPFSREWEWRVDVTDFLPLFRDGNVFGLFIDTWPRRGAGGGFLASVALDFYPGRAARVPIAVVNLWQGEPTLGEPSRPISAFFDARAIAVPDRAGDARVRLSVTGHGRGQGPSDPNAAEFLRVRRELRVGGATFGDTLSKIDNYLNPCRPQRGKWATDRAGWGPGSIVAPWTIEVGGLLGRGVGRTLTLEYENVDDYVNDRVGKGDPPTHWIDGQVIFYADVPPG